MEVATFYHCATSCHPEPVEGHICRKFHWMPFDRLRMTACSARRAN